MLVVQHRALATPAAIPRDAPVDLTRQQAQRLAQLELSDPAYRAGQPGLIERAIRWLVEWVQEVADRASAVAPGGWIGILGLVVVVVVVALFVRWRIGPVSRTDAMTFTIDPGTSAARYRAQADELATAGRWDEAISQRMRALVRRCQERGLIDAHPGWTADEVAEAVGRRAPAALGPLELAARTFDEVRYGGRPGSPAGYRAVAEADEAVADAADTGSAVTGTADLGPRTAGVGPGTAGVGPGAAGVGHGGAGVGPGTPGVGPGAAR